MDINVKEHTIFLNGYMDAVGRFYTNDKELVGITVQELENKTTLEEQLDCTIKSTNEVEDITIDFEKTISGFLNVDPRERMIFYLTEYVMWYKEFTKSLKCYKHELIGENIPTIHAAYTLEVNNKHKIFIYLLRAIKNA